jgi:hypothetical protein
MKAKQNKAITGVAKALSIGAIMSWISLSSASAAPHQNYSLNQRAGLQQQHALEGIRSGLLTNGEASRIKSHLTDMSSQMQSARAANNGRLTETERDRMEKAQNRAAQKIFQLKHNQNTAVPDRQVDRMNRQEEHVKQGIQNGQLTQGEVSRIKTHEEGIKDNLQKAASTGGLTQAQVKQANQAQDQAAQKIYQLKHNQNTPGQN